MKWGTEQTTTKKKHRGWRGVRTGWEAVNMWGNGGAQVGERRLNWAVDPLGERCHPKQKAEQEHRRSLTLAERPSHDPEETGNRKCDPWPLQGRDPVVRQRVAVPGDNRPGPRGSNRTGNRKTRLFVVLQLNGWMRREEEKKKTIYCQRAELEKRW